MVWELVAYATDGRDVRHREYTRSKAMALAWSRIPRVDFTDSGHGIVFAAREHQGKRERLIYGMRDHVEKHFPRLLRKARSKP
jgi:hypothetical protein